MQTVRPQGPTLHSLINGNRFAAQLPSNRVVPAERVGDNARHQKISFREHVCGVGFMQRRARRRLAFFLTAASLNTAS
jgi:hypothetical protein